MKKWMRIDDSIATLVRYFSAVDPRKSSPIIYVNDKLFVIRSVDDIWMVAMRLKEEYEPMRIPVKLLSNYPTGVLVREVDGVLIVKSRSGEERIELPEIPYVDWSIVRQYMELDTPIPLPANMTSIFDEKNLLGQKLFRYSTVVTLLARIDEKPLLRAQYLCEDVVRGADMFRMMSGSEISEVLALIRNGVRLPPTSFTTFSWLFKRSVKLANRLADHLGQRRAYMGFYVDETMPVEMYGWRIADALVVDVAGIRIVNAGLKPNPAVFRRMLASAGVLPWSGTGA